MKTAISRTEIEAFGKLDLIARQIVQGFITGLHKSPFHGFSVEFAEHRLYNQGESTRHIDWKLYGRSDKLFVKQYEEETNLRCRFLIDTSNSMFYPEERKNEFNKISFSCYAVAALSEILKRQRDSFGISYFNNELTFHSEVKATTAHQSYIFSELEELMKRKPSPENRSSTDIVLALHQIAEQIHKRSLVFLFSDMFDKNEDHEALFDALQHLKHNKHEVVLFHVLDKKTELDFNFGNLPLTFVDLESGAEIKANPNQIKASYVEKVQGYKKALQLKCGNYRIDYVETDVNEGFNKILMNYLLKRQQLV